MQKNKTEDELNLRQYLDVALEYKYVIGAIIFLFLVMGFVLYKLETPVYSSTATIFIDDDKNQIGDLYSDYESIKVEIIGGIALSAETVSQAIKELDLENEIIIPDVFTVVKMKLGLLEKPYDTFLEKIEYYKKNVAVNYKNQNSLITITVTNQNPKNAADIANKIAEITLDRIKSQSKTELNKGLNYLDQKINAINQILGEERKKVLDLQVSSEYEEVEEINQKIESTKRLIEELKNKIYSYEEKIVELEKHPDRNEFRDEIRQNEELKEHYELELENTKKELESYQLEYTSLDKTAFYEVDQLESKIKMDEGIYNSLVQNKEKAIIGQLFEENRVKFLSRAWVPYAPSQFKGIKNMLVFLMMGFVASGGIIFTLQSFNKRFVDGQEVEEILGLNVLGNIPKIKQKEEKKITHLAKSSFVEAYKTLRTNIRFADKTGKLKILGVTSPEAKAGKSFTAKNLATVMAGSGDSVLLIDCDLRKPTIHSSFKIQRKPGLIDVLTGKVRLDKAIVKIKNNLYILPSGSLHYNPQEVLESKQMKQLLKIAKEKFDVVICDSIPVLTASDSEVLASLVDSNILVINLNTSKNTAIEAKEILNKIKVPILGAVINNKKQNNSRDYYYYHDYNK